MDRWDREGGGERREGRGGEGGQIDRGDREIVQELKIECES